MGVNLKLTSGAFSYGNGYVFEDLNLQLNDGEVFSILGPNGCGKSTLLRCLSGHLRLGKGCIMLGGCDISSLNPVNVAKKIGIVFQDHSVPFPYPVIEVVRMGRAPHLSVFASPSQEDTEIAEEMLETVGIYHLKDKPYTQISGGERQLTLIARTLTQQPEIILLDEPTSHLDFRNQVLILNIIDKLSQSGFSIIMSSHFPNHVLSLSSKVALMNTGRFIAVGQAEEVMTEGNLKETYGIEVQVISYKDPQTNESMRLCIPKKL